MADRFGSRVIVRAPMHLGHHLRMWGKRVTALSPHVILMIGLAVFLVYGFNPNYRYSHWMITATCIATVIFFIQRKRGANAQ